jgi:hypothetical protein
MRRELVCFSVLALFPAMAGPLEAEARGVAVPLCGGSSISLPMGPEGPPGPPQGPCCAKGCKNGSSRKRLDRSQ